MIDQAPARAEAEATMIDTAVVTRTSDGTWTELDRMGGTQTVVWSGVCTVLPGLSGRDSDAGGAETSVDRWTVIIPVSATGPQPGDTVAVTSDDPDIPTLTVERMIGRTHAVTHRLICVAAVNVQQVPR